MKNLIKILNSGIIKKNLLIKAFIFLILLTTNACSTAINSINNSKNENMSISEYKNKTINFKDFKNIGQLEKYLNEAYPAGSDINNIIEDMKKGGAKNPSLTHYSYNILSQEIKDKIKSKNFIFCCRIYGAQSVLFHQWDWHIGIEKSNDGTIKSIKVWTEYSGL